jgi:hypothetical protein
MIIAPARRLSDYPWTARRSPGVTRHKRRWRAQASFQHRRLYLGLHLTEAEAHQAFARHHRARATLEDLRDLRDAGETDGPDVQDLREVLEGWKLQMLPAELRALARVSAALGF